ncbi:MAG: hypothetical protein IT437_02590 [Phycisphaerales bacterium]|nr:hypothetical protein [Phycisphaerales bacterium]
MKAPQRIVLVGHCGPDAAVLRSTLRRLVPGATVDRANDDGQVAASLPTADLLLVNRALDGDFEAADGVEMIRSLPPGGPITMLISNFPHAQESAVAAGAAPGFGKAEIGAQHTADRLAYALTLALSRGQGKPGAANEHR